MAFHLAAATLLAPDYDAALDFYVGGLGFELVEDTPLSPEKRWVLIQAPGGGSRLLIARAAGEEQTRAIGRQAGGRVFLFLHTDDFDRDAERFRRAGARFQEEPRQEPYGRVAVFADPFGNKWDLIEPD